MHILITSALSATARVIADSLVDNHMIRLTDLSHNANAEMIANDLDHGSLTDDLVSGVARDYQCRFRRTDWHRYRFNGLSHAVRLQPSLCGSWCWRIEIYQH
ncbi:MAG: hypothetical protein CM1200mP39_22100 [Dehalococcoidia bacterium]|nr:MAG: hypothetical protein CM1200mP39_22100 [Dehalococcoidia bacterium]